MHRQHASSHMVHLILRVRLEVLADLRLGQRPVVVLVGPIKDVPREVDSVFAALHALAAEGGGTHWSVRRGGKLFPAISILK